MGGWVGGWVKGWVEWDGWADGEVGRQTDKGLINRNEFEHEGEKNVKKNATKYELIDFKYKRMFIDRKVSL